MAAEDPFASPREVSYDYAGLDLSPLLGKTLFRPATIFALDAIKRSGGFHPDEVSPQKAVALRSFPVLLICGTEDHRIPCRHAQAIYLAAAGPEELRVRRRPRDGARPSPCRIRKPCTEFLRKISDKISKAAACQFAASGGNEQFAISGWQSAIRRERSESKGGATHLLGHNRED